MPSDNQQLEPSVALDTQFEFGEVTAAPRVVPPSPAPPLGPLTTFVGKWHGSGFNTIFRPDSPETPTPLPQPILGSDNILELNLTSEVLTFSESLGSVPNRGMVQADIFLNGVPYIQAINDITTGKSTGIHFEPGLWVIVPPTTHPAEGQTLVRMASIPHGTTINAQGTSIAFDGAPKIDRVDITPFIQGEPANKVKFSSQDAANGDTARLPQDLTPFINAGTITQQILDDPNTVLREAIGGQHIVQTTAISIATAPALPLFGGGTDNIAFLWGNAAAVNSPHPTGQNAQTLQMTATFWIEQVQHTILVPPFKPGEPPLTLQPEDAVPGRPAPVFVVRPPIPILEERLITVTSPQIQYSQKVELNFNGLTWPHVSVATLVPAAVLPVPPSVW